MVRELLASIYAAYGAMACVPHGAVTPATSSVELRLDRALEVDGLSLTWISVEDSRCPRDVTCIWAGEVTVWIRARGGALDEEISLTRGPRPGAELVEIAGHELRLSGVEPYPRAGSETPRDAYRATIVVTPQGK